MSYITKTIARSMANGDYLEVTLEERDGSGTLSPGFSVTGSLWMKESRTPGRARKRLGREWDAGGCLHDEVLKAFPHLAPVVKVHLANQDGLPMYAKSNGWHFYSGNASTYEREMIAKGRDYGYSRLLERTDRDRAAEALHIEPSELPAGMGKEQFEAFVDGLADRYAADAAEARRIMASLTNGAGVEPVR